MKKRVRIYAEGGPAEEQAQGQPQGGGQMEQLMAAVQQMLQQGAQPVQVAQQLLGSQVPPEAIMQVFVQMGMPQEEAQMSIQQAMQGGQEQQQMQGPGEEQMEGAASNPQEEQMEMQQPQGPTDEQLQMAFGGPAPLNENSTSYIRDRQANFINAIRKNTFSSMAKKNIFGNDGTKMKYGGDLPKAWSGNLGDYKTKDAAKLAMYEYNADPANAGKLIDINAEMAKWKEPTPNYDVNKMYKPDGKGGWTEATTGAAQNPNIIYLQNPYGYNPRPINRLFNTPMRMPSSYNVHGLPPGMTPNMFMGEHPGGKLDDGRTWGVTNVNEYKEGPFWNRHKGVRYTINWGNNVSGSNTAQNNATQSNVASNNTSVNNQSTNNVSSNTNSRINPDGSIDASSYVPSNVSYQTNKEAKKINAKNPDPYADPFYKKQVTPLVDPFDVIGEDVYNLGDQNLPSMKPHVKLVSNNVNKAPLPTSSNVEEFYPNNLMDENLPSMKAMGGNLYKATGGVDAMAIRPRPSLGVSPERLEEMRTIQQDPTVVDFQEQKGRINPMWLNAAADTMMNTMTGINSFAAQMAQYDPEREQAMKSASNAYAGQLQNQGYDQFGNFMGGNQMGAQNLNPTDVGANRNYPVYSLGGKVYDFGGPVVLTEEEKEILRKAGY